MPRHEIVVCTENIPYMVWQAMLFHHSCMRHLGQAPIIMVHMNDEPLLSGFDRIRERGGHIQTAPNYHHLNGIAYPARNTAGSMRHVQTDADYIVLCDPDMIFLQPLPWRELSLEPQQVSFDFVGYLNADDPQHQPVVDNVCRQADVDPQSLRNPHFNGGVPHVIPIRRQKSLSDLWFEQIEVFQRLPTAPLKSPDARPDGGHIHPQTKWISIMWALAIAVKRLNLQPVLTRMCISNFDGGRPLPALGKTGPRLIHYCYQDPGFGKHAFGSQEAAERSVWRVPPDDGSVCGNIRQQLRDACGFYGFS